MATTRKKARKSAIRKGALGPGVCKYGLRISNDPMREDRYFNKKTTAVKSARSLARKYGETVRVEKVCMSRAGKRQMDKVGAVCKLNRKTGKIVCKNRSTAKRRAKGPAAYR